jgi:DNA-binding response OmpR family regulator
MEEIKSDPETSHMTTIMLSAAPSSPEVRQKARWQADAYLQKPYTPHILTDLIKELMWSSMGGRRYLIVDDSTTFTQALAGKLRQADNEILTAKSGEEALEILSQQIVDCIVIDMVMPGMGGLEACQRIRALPSSRQVPIVMLTASENLTARSEGQLVGADEFLVKQADLDLLCAQLRSIMRKSTLRPRRPSGQISIPKASTPSHAPKGLYEEVLALTGLSHWVARMAVSRACAKVGVVASSITAGELSRILPALAEHLRMFMARAEADKRLLALAELTRAGTSAEPTLSK